MIDYLNSLKKDGEQFIEVVNDLSNEDFVGIFGYFGDVYFNNEDIDEYLVNKGYVLGTLIVPDEMKDRMRIWKDEWFDCINNKQKSGEISPEEAIKEKEKAFDSVEDMIKTYERNCLEYLCELYQKYEDEIDTYFILDQRDRIIEDLKDEYL